MNKTRATNLMKVNALAAALMAMTATSVNAIEFSSDDGEWTGSFDTTISYGASWRISDLDPENVGKSYNNPLLNIIPTTNAERRAAPGRWSVNGDNGNRNYPDGGDMISHTIKFTSELDIRYRNFGAFTRFMGFYDFENTDNDFLPKDAEDRVGIDELEDRVDVGDVRLLVHLGNRQFQPAVRQVKGLGLVGHGPADVHVRDGSLDRGQSDQPQHEYDRKRHGDRHAPVPP